MLRLMQLMASANVAHNVIQTPKNLGFELHLPVSFGWFADGMAVIAANQPYARVVGLRVRSIGSQTPEQLLEVSAPFLSHENQAWLQAIGPGFLELPRWLSTGWRNMKAYGRGAIVNIGSMWAHQAIMGASAAW